MSRESEIIQRAAAEFIHDRHRLGASIGGLLRDAHAAEDVIQEIWVRLAPEISKGDVVIAIGTRWLSPEIKPGEHIVYRSDKGATICPVVKVDAMSVVVRTKTGEQLTTPKAELQGKVVRTIHLR